MHARLAAALVILPVAAAPMAAQTPSIELAHADTGSATAAPRKPAAPAPDAGTPPIAKAEAPKAADAKPLANSFVRTTKNGSFRLDVTGRVQGLYQLSSPDAHTNEILYGADYANKQVPESQSLFRIRRGRVGFEGYAYDPKYEYNVQVELAGPSLFLKRAYLNYRMLDGDVNVRVGKFKVPYGRQQLTSIFSQQLVDRSLVSDEFAKGDDDGAMLWGTPYDGKLEYYVGVFNGEGNNKNSQQDNVNQYAARVVWSPLGRFAYTGPALGAPSRFAFSLGANANLNGGWLYEVNGTTGMQSPLETCTAGICVVNHGDDARIRNVGLDAAAKWNRVSWIAEAFARRVDPLQSGLADIDARGWYTQAGAFVKPDRFEAGVRYGQLDPNRVQSNDMVTEVSPFFNVYLRGNDFKVQTDYTFLHTETTDGAAATPKPTTFDDARLRVQFLVSF
jgi:phosphate-selective porin